MTSRRRYLRHVLPLREAAVERRLAVGKPHFADEVLGCGSLGRVFQLDLPHPVTPTCSPLIQNKPAGPGFLSWLPQRQHRGHGTAKNLELTTGPLGCSIPWVLGTTITMGYGSFSQTTGPQKRSGSLENLFYA